MERADSTGQAEREKRRAAVRGVHLEQLAGAGALRSAALEKADQQLDRIAKLLPDALAAGLSLVEIARVTGVSRPTLYELRGRYGDSASDLGLALLQTLATSGPLPLDRLHVHLGRKGPKLAPVLDSFNRQDLIEYAPLEDQDGVSVDLTAKGIVALEHWFEETIEQELSE